MIKEIIAAVIEGASLLLGNATRAPDKLRARLEARRARLRAKLEELQEKIDKIDAHR